MSQPNFDTQEQQNDSINITEIIERYLYHWKFILFSVLICLSISFVYLRYTQPTYSSATSVIIKDTEKNAGGPDLSALEDLGFSNSSKGLENEIEVFKSRTLIQKIVKELKLNEQLFIIGERSGIERAKLYSNKPIVADYVYFDTTALKETFAVNVEILDHNNIELSLPSGKSLKTKFGKIIEFAFGSARFLKDTTYLDDFIGKTVVYYISPIEKTVNSLKNKLTVNAVNKDADILSLSITGHVIEENNAFLDALVKQHRIDAIKDKNQVAENTNDFLNKRLALLENQLASIEEQGKNYKKDNALTDVETDAERFIEQKSEIETAITKSEIQLSLAAYMNDYIENFGDDKTELLPANLGFEDVSINQMTAQYNTLVLEKQALLRTSSIKNPAIHRINGQLESIRASLTSSLKNLQSRIKLEIEILKKQDSGFQSKIAALPQFELDYRGIIRQQEIKESLYIFLLKKREENEITMASAVSNTKTIDLAYSDKIPVSPKKTIIYLGAFLLGLIVPISFIYVRDLLDTKLKTAKDIEEIGLPLAGSIPHAEEDSKLITKENLRTPIAEAFRMLRTNINFLLNSEKEGGKVIYVTSTVAEEGKTLTSLNLARSLAFTDKKILVIGLDLRKPKLLEYLQQKQGLGVSDYLANPNLRLEELFIPSQEFDNLTYLSSGTIPPNPSELLLNKRLADLFETVRKNYDYIIVDTAPASLVTDTISVSHLSDLTIYVTRANVLDKRMLRIPVDFYKRKSLGEMAILVNGIKSGNGSKRYGYYSYGYNYGYGDEKKKSLFGKLFSRK
ncbi:MAG: GumC family protein [Lishizhenia sp.]